MTRDELFNLLETSAKWDIGVAINRTNPVPLDLKAVFEDYDSLVQYAQTDPVAYPGQLVAVVGTSEIAAYIITATGESGAVEKLASVDPSTNLEEAVDQLQTQVAGILDGTTAVPKAIADANGNNIADTYATKATATSSTAGLMSSGDKAKLDTIAENAQVNVIEGVAVKATASGEFTPVSIQGKIAQVDLSGIDTNITNLTGRMTTAEGEIDTLQSQIQGLTGAMHFVGTSTTDPTLEEGPTIADHEGDYVSGDVCFFGGLEYIYDGTNWREFGNEGEHLTKEVADTYYVPLARTVNGHALNANITLTATDVGAATTADISNAIGNLDAAAVSVDPDETISSISETDGVISVTKQDIAIPHTAVTDWDTELAKKQDKLPVEGTGLLKMTEGVPSIDTTDYISSEEAEATYLGISDAAASVAHNLKAGSKTFNGSADVEITAADLGALTAVPAASDSSLGGILTGYESSGNTYAVQLDENNKAYVEVPAAPVYTAAESGGLSLAGNAFSIATAGVQTSMIGDAQVTDAKIAAVNVNKLQQTEGDTLILNGGVA